MRQKLQEDQDRLEETKKTERTKSEQEQHKAHQSLKEDQEKLDSLLEGAANLKFYRLEGFDKDFWNHYCARNKLTTHLSVKDNITPREWTVMDKDYANKTLIKNHKALNVYDWALWHSLV